MLLEPSNGSNTTQLAPGISFVSSFGPVVSCRQRYSLGTLASANDDSLIILLGYHDATFSTCSEGVDHDIVTEDIQLFLVFTLDIGSSGQTDQVDKTGFTDVGCDIFGGHLRGSAHSQVAPIG